MINMSDVLKPKSAILPRIVKLDDVPGVIEAIGRACVVLTPEFIHSVDKPTEDMTKRRPPNVEDYLETVREIYKFVRNQTNSECLAVLPPADGNCAYHLGAVHHKLKHFYDPTWKKQAYNKVRSEVTGWLRTNMDGTFGGGEKVLEVYRSNLHEQLDDLQGDKVQQSRQMEAILKRFDKNYDDMTPELQRELRVKFSSDVYNWGMDLQYTTGPVLRAFPYHTKSRLVLGILTSDITWEPHWYVFDPSEKSSGEMDTMYMVLIDDHCIGFIPVETE